MCSHSTNLKNLNSDTVAQPSSMYPPKVCSPPTCSPSVYSSKIFDGSCSQPNRLPTLNIVKDYRILENHPDPGAVSLRQNIDTKYVRVENSSRHPVFVGIDISFEDVGKKFDPKRPLHQGKMFYLDGGESKDLAVNQPHDTQQFLFIYDAQTKKLVNTPFAMDARANLFVINKGTNNFWIGPFHRSGF